MSYEINDREYEDADTAARHLTALFIDMCLDLDIDYGNDSVAWRECFNNWTDCLNREGLLCDKSYNDLCPAGPRFE